MTWEELPITKIEQVIGYQFKNKNLLRQAFATVRYWYEKTSYNHDLLPYIGNAIIMDEIDNLVKENKLSIEKAAFIKSYHYQVWLDLMDCLEFINYLIYAADERLTNYQLFDEVASIFPLIVCAVYFDENYQVTNNVKNVIDNILRYLSKEREK